jgi:cytochrome c oxidase subunit 3
MAHAAIYQSEHETSVWPMLVGFGVLLTPLTVLAYFVWQMPMVSVVLGGGSLALLAVGFAGWAKEFFQHGTEEGLGPIAVAAFIVSEVVIFGTVFVAFWLGRINHADQWASFIPADLDRMFALWLTVILWASSATIMLSQRAFERDRRGLAMFWLFATFALGSLFVVLHIGEWSHLAAGGFTLGSNIYGTTFYGLTGIHTSHVIVGLASHLLLFGVVAGGLMKFDQVTFYRGAALYWHFVDIMWLLVAANVYLIGSTS